VTLYEKEDGSVEILYKNKPLAFSTYNSQEKQGEIVDSKRLNEAIDNLQKRQEGRKKKSRYKPLYNHPWKRGARKQLFTKSPLFPAA
jgi:hypothetical protein